VAAHKTVRSWLRGRLPALVPCLATTEEAGTDASNHKERQCAGLRYACGVVALLLVKAPSSVPPMPPTRTSTVLVVPKMPPGLFTFPTQNDNVYCVPGAVATVCYTPSMVLA
jgi:hypothetical protein